MKLICFLGRATICCMTLATNNRTAAVTSAGPVVCTRQATHTACMVRIALASVNTRRGGHTSL